MKIKLLVYILLCFLEVSGQHTFSIVAVDPSTQEVGSAGATCLGGPSVNDGAYVISSIIPGRGAINTQSYWDPRNQNLADERMNLGENPQEIMDWLVSNDVANQPGLRQYGAADLSPNNEARAAAFTGQDCFDYKGHHIGANYAIQGNILLGPEILDSMEARFLATEDLPLQERLMAAMQGANVAGADERCLNEGVSSRSAFVRIAKKEDDPSSLYLDLSVPQTPFGVEPIDELQKLFDAFMILGVNDQKPTSINVYPNPAQDRFLIEGNSENLVYRIYSVQGQMVKEGKLDQSKTFINIEALPDGIYYLKGIKGGKVFSSKLIKLNP